VYIIFEVRNLMKRIIDLGIELSYSITTCIKDECNEKQQKSKTNNDNNKQNINNEKIKQKSS
jgi:hypothetical protein